MGRQPIRTYQITASATGIVFTDDLGSAVTANYDGIATEYNNNYVIVYNLTTVIITVYYGYLNNQNFKSAKDAVQYINELVELNYSGTTPTPIFYADTPLYGDGTTSNHLRIYQASAIQSGYLSDTDWNTFNNKLTSVLTNGYIFVGNGSNVATGVAMSSEATIINTGAVTLSNSAVIGKVLTGYSASAGTIAATDTILQAFGKVGGNFGLYLPLAGGTMLGDIVLGSNKIKSSTGNSYITTIGSQFLSRCVSGTYTTDISNNGSYLQALTTNSSTGYGSYFTLQDYQITLQSLVGGTSSNMVITPTSFLISCNYATFAGATYNADYSANYTNRSLIDKGYADATYAPISGGAYIPLAGSSLITGDLKYTKGSAANFGTADAFGLNIITNNSTVIAISNAGVSNFKNDLTFTKGSAVNFGTTDAFDLAIATNNTEKARLTSAGLFGLGKTPTVALDILASSAANANVRLKENTGAGGLYSFIALNLAETVSGYFGIKDGGADHDKDTAIITNTNNKDIFIAPNYDVNTGGTGAIRFATGGYNGSLVRGIIDENGKVAFGVAFSSFPNRPTTALVETFTIGGSLGLTGTGGAGYLGIVAQSSAPTAPSATGLNIYSDANGDLAFTKKNGSDNYDRVIASTITADRTYTLSDSDQTLAAQTGVYFGRYSGYYYEIPKGVTDNLSGTGWIADRIWATPFPLCNMNTISELRVEVTTLVAASTIEIGVYADDGTGYPGTLLGRGSVDSSSTGFKTVTGLGLTNLLQYKQVWLALKMSSNSVGIRYTGVALPLIPRTTGAESGGAYYYAGAAGNLPNTFAAGATLHKASSGVHLIGVKM